MIGPTQIQNLKLARELVAENPPYTTYREQVMVILLDFESDHDYVLGDGLAYITYKDNKAVHCCGRAWDAKRWIEAQS